MRRKGRATAKLDRKTLGAAAVLAVSVLLILTGLLMLHTWEEEAGTASTPTITSTDALTYYDGAWYQPREGLETILAIGVDQAAVDDTLRRENHPYEQSDFLMLLVLNRNSQSYTAIHINRDTMAEISVLDDDTNQFLGTFTGQLALAHAYGNRPEACCKNTVAAVSNLLYHIKIDHYLSLALDGIPLLNDIAGGVTLEVMDDLTSVDASLIEGETITLDGTQALTYVRARRGLEDPTNVRRMERQRQYLEALQAQLAERAGENEGFTMEALLKLNDYMVSDCTVEQLSRLSDTLRDYAPTGYRTLEGEQMIRDEHMEYHVDQDALQKLVMEMFYEPVAQDEGYPS